MSDYTRRIDALVGKRMKVTLAFMDGGEAQPRDCMVALREAWSAARLAFPFHSLAASCDREGDGWKWTITATPHVGPPPTDTP